VDTHAGPAGLERGHREVLSEQADGCVEPEPYQPQRQRSVQVRGQQRGRSDRAVGQRGRATQARGSGRNQRVRANQHRGQSQVHCKRQPSAVHHVQVSRRSRRKLPNFDSGPGRTYPFGLIFIKQEDV